MSPSVTARLTLWYAVGLAVVVIVFAGGMYAAHWRLSLDRLDEELRRTSIAVINGINIGLDQGGDLSRAVANQQQALVIPGRTVIAFTRDGRVIPGEWERLPREAVEGITSHVPNRAWTMPTSRGEWRMFLTPHDHYGDQYWLLVGESLTALKRDRDTLKAALLVGAPLAVLIAAVTSGWLARAALKPVDAMARQAETITDRNLNTRLAVGRNDELGRLASSFNDVLDRLQRSLQLQREFMADASHELRTPLSVARMAAEVTLDGTNRPEAEYRDALATILQNVHRLTRMVNSMLLLARADCGAQPLEIVDFYLDELVTECVRDANVLARTRQTRIRAQIADETMFRGDEGLLRQMLLNLIDNAIRYSPPGSDVDVIIEHDDAEITVAVSDSGPGIPEIERERIFERFVRLDPARQSGGGAGLGLALARSIAMLHGGTLTLNQGDGRGSVFVARLPYRRRAASSNVGHSPVATHQMVIG